MGLRVYLELEIIVLTKINNTKVEVHLMACWKQKNKVNEINEL